MHPATTPLSADEDSMELMYLEQDVAAIGVNQMPLPCVDWISVGRDCCGPQNTVGKGTAGAAANESSKIEG